MQLADLVALETIDPREVERLLDRAFGVDRRTRTAYRLRDGLSALLGPSLAAVHGDILVGSIQLWPLIFTGDDGARVPLTLVGPVAVAPDRQQTGIGRMLMRAALAAVPDHGLMLIGDPEYYGRFFGFTAERTVAWRLPGPVERHRLLARGDAVPPGAGTIGPRVSVAA